MPNHKIALGGGTRNTVTHNNVVNVTVNGAGGRPQDNQDLAEKVGRALHNSMRAMIAGEIHTQSRNGGVLAR